MRKSRRVGQVMFPTRRHQIRTKMASDSNILVKLNRDWVTRIKIFEQKWIQ